MRLTHFLLAPAAALLLDGAAPAARNADPAAAARMRAHVEFLAADRLEGRATGSSGYASAASYVAGQFKALGLSPGAGLTGWYHQLRFRNAANAANAAPPVVRFTIGGKEIAFAHGREVAVSPSMLVKQRSLRAGLVFVGHGISEPALGIDEYAGLDVRGKIVIALDGTVRGLRTDIATHLDAVKERTAAAKGAVGFIEIARIDGAAARQPLVQALDDSGTKVASAAPLAVEMAMSPDAAERLFAGAPRGLQAMRSAPGRDRPVAGFALAGEMSVESRSDWQDYTAPQVIGLIRGSDPVLRDEYVVLMAHLDHLGIDPGAQPGEDGIFNGAIDNAAGIATLIEVARAFSVSGSPPRRSVLLIATAGEERGLLGAYSLAAQPPVPLGQITAVINLDMPLLLYDFTDVIAFGAEHSTIVDAVAEAGRTMGVAVTPDPMPEQNLFIRSDHYPFVLQGVPSIFLVTGHANGGRQAWNRFLTRTYHRPHDDARQPIRWKQGARFAALNYRIARTLADQAGRPRWQTGDYFGARLLGRPVPMPVTPPR